MSKKREWMSERDRILREDLANEPGAFDGCPRPPRRRQRHCKQVFTFLQFLLEDWLGPPLYNRGNGLAAWDDCPYCGGGGTFQSRPHKPDQKDRWHCWKCDQYGDELDVIIAELSLKGQCTRSQAYEILAQKHKEYIRLCPDGLHLKEPKASIRPAGLGASTGKVLSGDGIEVELTAEDVDLLKDAAALCDELGANFYDLVRVIQDDV